MPRYFFHVDDGSGLPDDDEGVDLTSVTDARREAASLAGLALQEGAAGFWDGQPWSVRCTDEAGRLLFTLCLTASSSEPDTGPGFQKPLG